MAPLIDRILQRLNTDGEFAVHPGSSLHGDDKATSPYQTSHAIRLCLTVGVDHLHAAKTLVVDQRILHLGAPSTLARVALESFATAYWILGPAARKERVFRTLQWHAKNLRDSNIAMKPLGLTSPQPKLDRLFAVARRNGIASDALTNYTVTNAVKFAEEASQSPFGVVFPWRLCSGIAHGRFWAYLGGLDIERSEASEPGLVNIRMTSSSYRAQYPNLAAMHLLVSLLRLHSGRSSSPFA